MNYVLKSRIVQQALPRSSERSGLASALRRGARRSSGSIGASSARRGARRLILGEDHLPSGEDHDGHGLRRMNSTV